MLDILSLISFDGLATILAGSVAIWVFYSQKKEREAQAATILLQEIRDAEANVESISKIMNSDLGNDYPQVLPVNSWRIYSHLFAKKLDQDQLKAINDFYGDCEVIQEMVLKQNNFFWVNTEERARVYQKMLGDLVLQNKSKTEIEACMKKYDTDAKDSYAPVKTINVIKIIVGKFRKLTTTSVVEKLKTFSN